MERDEALRELPAVDRLARVLREVAAGDGCPVPTEAEAVAAARAVLAERRDELLACRGGEVDAGEHAGRGGEATLTLVARARERLRPSLRRVLNATGVIVHTNMGRAPLADEAVAAVQREARGYSSLELDLATGARGSRHAHVRDTLCELTGAEDAIVVNNGAAAALLAIAALGGGGVAAGDRGGAGGQGEAGSHPAHGFAVSRGQLVEIGGGFRVPEVLEQAGVPMIEVGTTNRTRLADYERAIAGGLAGAILRVHQSNFRTVGFVEEVEIDDLCALGVPVIDDLGSGALAEGVPALAGEPPVRRSVQAGAALVCFSADKLLGGPQAGLIVGRADAVAACRAHPLARALRIGRLALAALTATLSLYRDPQRALCEIPVLAMLAADEQLLAERARRIAGECGGEVVQAVAKVGGGALPLAELHGPAVALGTSGTDVEALAAALRAGDPPLVARIAEGRVLIDPRTLLDEEIELAGRLAAQALASL